MIYRLLFTLVLFSAFVLAPFSPAFSQDQRTKDNKTRTKSVKPAPTFWKDVAVVTGDVENAGTNAKVYLTLIGEKSSSAEMELTWPAVDFGHPPDPSKAPRGYAEWKERVEAEKKKPKPDYFERGQWDDFPLQLRVDCGRIKAIRLRHDNTGDKPGWHPFLVRVRDRQTGEVDIFMVNRWLATDEDDKKIDITVSRADHLKSTVITPPYYDKYEWTNAPGIVSRARTSAYRTNGWFYIYADAWIGGSVAEAGHKGYFDTYGSWPIAIKALLTYVGGPINFGIASFPEMQTCIRLNGAETRNDLKAAFSGDIIKDRIKKIINLTSDKQEDMVKPYEEFLARVSEGQNYAKLVNSFGSLQNAGEAAELNLCKIGRTQPGSNWVTATLRTNTGAVLTGSSVVMAAGIVKSIEVVGLPARLGLTPPKPEAKAVKIGKVEITSAAQQLGKTIPGGSYKNSCGECTYDENAVLRCECKCGSTSCEKASGGKFRTTELPQADKCASGVMNADGNLMCQGSFEKSCGSCVLSDDKRMCCNDCKDKKGKKRYACVVGPPSSLNWKNCFVGLSNCDGNLICGPCK